MADTYKSPFGTYTNVAGVIGVAAAAQVVTAIGQLTTFLNPANGLIRNHPGFDHIDKEAMTLILGEIAGMAAAIAAAPTV